MSHRFRKEESVRRPEIDLALARANAAQSSSNAEQTTFVLRAGGVAAKNVYTDWPTLAAAAAAVQGPRIIEIDTSLGAAVVPAGTWDLGSQQDVQVIASKLITTITIQDGAHFSQAIYRWSGIQIVFQGTTPAYAVTNYNQSLIFDGDSSSSLKCTGGSAFAAATGTGEIRASFYGSMFTINFGGGGVCLSSAGAGSQLFVKTFDIAAVLSNTLSIGAGSTFAANVDSPASSISATQVGGPLVQGVTLFFNSTTNVISGPGGSAPAVQAGKTTLTNGTSPAISAVLTSSSVITCSLNKASGAGSSTTTAYTAPVGTRNVGAQTFVIIAQTTANATANANDNSDVDWIVIN